MSTSPLHVLDLAGCTPSPLAHYLKALAILKLVAEQADPRARGCWRGDTFRLVTSLDRQGLEHFFREVYHPTPLVAPWNGGSGFYPKDRKVGIDAIARSRAGRFDPYREAIALGRELTRHHDSAPKKDEKARLMRSARARASPEMRAWIDAAFVITGDGDPKYPALLGTGGNDGRLDFTNNFMQRLAEIFELADPNAAMRASHRRLLTAALWGTPTTDLSNDSVGQFLPGGAGGPNSTRGFMGPSLVNPWDFVLMLEGAVLFRSSVVRRSATREAPWAAAPFALHADAAGYASAQSGEKNRGEQWMPLWQRPATAGELAQIFAEGRSQIGRGSATRPLDFARAVARFGVARGITAFERYGYIERNGQANLATPLGRWIVHVDPGGHQELLDEVAGWIDHLRRIAADNHAPASFVRAARRCDECALVCCRPGAKPRVFRELLIALGRAERLAVTSPRFAGSKRFRPLPRLGARWIEAAKLLDLPNGEGRLALGLASLHGLESARAGQAKESRERGKIGARHEPALAPDPATPIRRHWLPLARKGTRWVFRTADDLIVTGPDQVGRSLDLVRDLLAVLRRRLITNAPGVGRSFGLGPIARTPVRLADIAAFLAGEVDDALILDLAAPLMALDWRHSGARRGSTRDELGSGSSNRPPPAHALLRLANPLTPPSPEPLPGTDIILPAPRIDPACLARVAAGDLDAAGSIARRRLLAAGRRPTLSTLIGAPLDARRIGASLVFPLAPGCLAALARLVLKQSHDPPHTST